MAEDEEGLGEGTQGGNYKMKRIEEHEGEKEGDKKGKRRKVRER